MVKAQLTRSFVQTLISGRSSKWKKDSCVRGSLPTKARTRSCSTVREHFCSPPRLKNTQSDTSTTILSAHMNNLSKGNVSSIIPDIFPPRKSKIWDSRRVFMDPRGPRVQIRHHIKTTDRLVRLPQDGAPTFLQESEELKPSKLLAKQIN